MSRELLGGAMHAEMDELCACRSVIDKELAFYPASAFAGKVVYCNCDKPYESEFVKHFLENFKKLGLKRLIATSYSGGQQSSMDIAMKLVVDDPADGTITGAIDSAANSIGKLEGNGDFMGYECLSLLDQADIVCTAPPFSLFRSFVDTMEEHGKKYLLLGHINAASCKSIFQLIMSGKLWLGASIHGGDTEFRAPSSGKLRAERREAGKGGKKHIQAPGIRWWTNIKHNGMPKPLELSRQYDPSIYKKYGSCGAIDIGRIEDMPIGYDGAMRVPLAFLDKHNPDQFEIIGLEKASAAKPVQQERDCQRSAARQRLCGGCRQACRWQGVAWARWRTLHRAVRSNFN